MEVQFNSRKRLKQACKNCRRKKARCPGERPICSFCDRLKQPCEYDDTQLVPDVAIMPSVMKQTKTSKLADRVAQLESKLSLLANINQNTSPTPATSPTSPTVSCAPSFDRAHSGDGSQFVLLPRQSRVAPDEPNPKFRQMPPPDVMLSAINLYFARCHSRPFTFFHQGNFRRNLESNNVPSYLILAIIACAAAISDDPWFEDRQLEAARDIEQTAWAEILTNVLPEESTIDVAAVQALSLLSSLDYRSGRYNPGTMKLRIAITLAQSLQMTTEPSRALPVIQQEERRYVLWSLYIIDRMSSAVLDRKSVLSDGECVLRLPENEQTFEKCYQNQMPSLMTVKDTSLPQESFLAKLVLAASKLGSDAWITMWAEPCPGLPFWHSEGRYAQLKEHTKYISDLCKADMLGPQSALNALKMRQNSPKEADCPALGHRLYTQISYHLLCITINHPFFVRQQLSLTELPCPTKFLQQTLKECQEHAELLTRFVSIIQQSGLYSQMSLFPGFVAFAAGIVHFLFMHSPNPELAERSRELYQKTLSVLLENATEDRTSHSHSFPAVLETLRRNPGVASLLVDPKSANFRYRSIPTSAWRLLDFKWLCEQLCIGSGLSSSLAVLSAGQTNQRHHSIATNTSDGAATESSRSSSIPTPQTRSSSSPLVADIDMHSTTTQARTRPSRPSLDCAFGHVRQNLSIGSSPSKSPLSKDIHPPSPLTVPQANVGAGFMATDPLPPETPQLWNNDTQFMPWVGISYNFPDNPSVNIPTKYGNGYPQQYGNIQQASTLENRRNKRHNSSDLY